MALNLRDKGYPQARTERVNRSDKRNALMTDQTQPVVAKLPQDMGGGFRQSEGDKALEKLVTAYNSRAFGNPNAPLVQKFSGEYVDDNYDSRALRSGLNLQTHDGNRLGYVDRDMRVDGTSYGAGIDNLGRLLGEDNYFDKSLNLPLGTLDVGYDGDTLSANMNIPRDNYYVQALYNLLNRGIL